MSMGECVGAIFATLGLQSSLKTDTEAAQKQLKGLEGKLQSTGAAFSGAGKKLSMGVTAPLVGLGAASIYTAANFDDSMRKVSATSQATGAEFDAMKAQALELGKTTRYSASEAADGMNYLAMAGFKTGEIMSTMPGLLDLASASSTDLADTANIASNVLTGFGLEAENMGHVSDVLALATATSNTNLVQLGDALSYAAPVASMFGMSLEQTTAAVGFFSNAGIQSTRAGTALNSMFTRLSNPSGDVTAMLESYGIALEDVNPATNEFTDILKTLEDAGVDASDMMALMGETAGPATAAALAQGYDGLAKYTEELENADGAAAKMSEEMEGGVGGNMREMKSALEGASIAIGTALIPAIVPLIDDVAKLANWFSTLSPGTQEFIVKAGLLAAALGPVLMVVGTVISAVGTLSGLIAGAGGLSVIVTGLGSILSGLAIAGGPITLVIAAIMGVYYAFKHWDEISGWVKTTVNEISGHINELITGLNGIEFEIPDWVPGIGGEGWSMSIPTIPMLASGGTITGAGSVLVGEEGPEILNLSPGASVVPLNKTGGAAGGTSVEIKIENMTVRNDSDIKRIAKELHSMINSGTRARGIY